MNDEQAREDWEKLVSKAVRNQDLYNAKLEVELRKILYAGHRIKALEEQLNRATRALIKAGFEDLRGQEWKPPLGKAPTFIESAPGWVSVNERLPYQNQPFLVSILMDDGTRHIDCLKTFKGGIFWLRSCHEQKYGVVTHWQPLPEPPKSEED